MFKHIHLLPIQKPRRIMMIPMNINLILINANKPSVGRKMSICN